MKLITLLFLLLGTNVFASQATDSALNQDPVFGSYYMVTDRSRFLSPALTEQANDSIELGSLGEIDFKQDDYAFSLGRRIKGHSLLDGFYQFNEYSGAHGFVSAKNGEGLTVYGANLGLHLDEGFNLYMGFQMVDDKFSHKLGFDLNAYDGVLFFEFKGRPEGSKEKILTAGYGKVYKNIFGDLTYRLSKYPETKSQNRLTVTIGGKVFLLEKLGAFASGSKDVFFGDKGKINAGLSYVPVERVELSLSHSLLAFGKPSPAYKDFDVIASIVYKI